MEWMRDFGVDTPDNPMVTGFIAVVAVVIILLLALLYVSSRDKKPLSLNALALLFEQTQCRIEWWQPRNARDAQYGLLDFFFDELTVTYRLSYNGQVPIEKLVFAHTHHDSSITFIFSDGELRYCEHYYGEFSVGGIREPLKIKVNKIRERAAHIAEQARKQAA